MFLQWKFDRFVARQEVIEHRVMDTNYTIRLPLNEVMNQGFSRVLAGYINAQKAEIEGENAYLIPDYDKKHTPPSARMLKKGKILQCVTEKSFVDMMSQAELIPQNNSNGEKRYYFKVSQSHVKKYHCIHVIAALLEENLALIEEKDRDIFIDYNYLNCLSEDTIINTDLTGFRTLIGESQNLLALLETVEHCEIQNNMIVLTHDKVKANNLRIELMSLCDIGMAKMTEKGFELNFKFASWLLEHISNTSDRLSFSKMCGE